MAPLADVPGNLRDIQMQGRLSKLCASGVSDAVHFTYRVLLIGSPLLMTATQSQNTLHNVRLSG
ncbi:hypothetical protein ACNKHX_01265 [Shigella flexneri]